MWQAGCVYFIQNFEFGPGIEVRDKYLIVYGLDINTGELLYGLTTTKEYADKETRVHGCSNDQRNSHYLFSQDRVIGMINSVDTFAFPRDTYNFFAKLNLVHITSLQKYFESGKASHVVNIEPIEFKQIIKCIKASQMAKKKVIEFVKRIHP